MLYVCLPIVNYYILSHGTKIFVICLFICVCINPYLKNSRLGCSGLKISKFLKNEFLVWRSDWNNCMLDPIKNMSLCQNFLMLSDIFFIGKISVQYLHLSYVYIYLYLFFFPLLYIFITPIFIFFYYWYFFFRWSTNYTHKDYNFYITLDV